jgi:polyhydroxybutyrate depolymerase
MKKHILFFLSSFASLAVFAQSEYTMNMIFDDSARNFTVFLPSAYAAGVHLPVVFNLHGRGSTAAQQEFYSKMDSTAQHNNFIVVYPNALGSQWNSIFGYDYHRRSDDVGFISKIIDTLSLLYSIDLTRVYSCGLSNGGYQSFRLACQLSDRIAAIAPVAGSMTDSTSLYCAISHKVPILQIQGTQDPIVVYEGAANVWPAENNVNYWLNKDQCTAVSDTTFVPDTNTGDNTTVQEIRYRTCADGSQFWFYKVIGGGHTWPGGALDLGILGFGNTNHDIDASQEIWDFFKRYTINGPVAAVAEMKSEATNINVFPNPFAEQFTLSLASLNSIEQNAVARIFDLNGRMVTEQKITDDNMVIKTPGLSPGMYLLKISGEHINMVQRIVKE